MRTRIKLEGLVYATYTRKHNDFPCCSTDEVDDFIGHAEHRRMASRADIRNNIRASNSCHGLLSSKWNGIVLLAEQVPHRYVLVCRVSQWRVERRFRLVFQVGDEIVYAQLG